MVVREDALIEGKESLYPFIIIFSCYTFGLFGLLSDLWFLLGALVSFVIGVVWWAWDVVVSQSLVNSLPRVEIEWCDNLEHDEEDDEDEELSKRIYGILDEPELLELSIFELEDAFTDLGLQDKFKEIKDTIKKYYHPDTGEPLYVELEYREGLRREECLLVANIRPEQVNFLAYPIEYALRRVFDSFLPKKIKWALWSRFIYKKKFIHMSKSELETLEKQLKEKYPDVPDLRTIQFYLKYKLKNYLEKDEIKYLKDVHQITNLGVLYTHDLRHLERVFNKKFLKKKRFFGKLTWFPLRKILLDLKEEVAKHLSEYIEKLDEDERVSFVRMRLIPLFMVYGGCYFYKMRLNRKFDVPIGIQKEEQKRKIKITKETIPSDTLIIVLTKPFEDSFRYRPRRIPFRGFSRLKCSRVEKIELFFIKMLLYELPVYWVNSCGYTRKHMRDHFKKPDKNNILLGMINVLMDEVYNIKLNLGKVTPKLRYAKNKIENLRDQLGEKKASEKTDRPVNERIKEKQEEIKKVWNPSANERKLFWFFTVLALIIGILIGFFIGIIMVV